MQHAQPAESLLPLARKIMTLPTMVSAAVVPAAAMVAASAVGAVVEAATAATMALYPSTLERRQPAQRASWGAGFQFMNHCGHLSESQLLHGKMLRCSLPPCAVLPPRVGQT